VLKETPIRTLINTPHAATHKSPTTPQHRARALRGGDPIFHPAAREILGLLQACARARKYVRVKCRARGGREYCLYRYTTPDWRPFYTHPCLAYARGTLVIDGAWLVLAFTKFFNAGETPDTALERLPERPRLACEKLDGTMVAMWRDPYTGELTGHTRGLLPWEPPPGTTAFRGNPYVARLLEYARENRLHTTLDTIVGDREVAIFELVVPGLPASRAAGRRETLAYARASRERGQPYLLAVRSLEAMRLDPARGLWPLEPRCIEGETSRGLRRLASTADHEGYVAWYERLGFTGPLSMLDPLVKFKSWEYLLRVSGIQTSRGKIAYALRGGLDDLRPQLSEEEYGALAQAVEEYQALQELLQKASTMLPQAKAHGLRGWLLTAAQNPDKTLQLILENGPRKIGKLPGWLRAARRRLERVVEALED